MKIREIIRRVADLDGEEWFLLELKDGKMVRVERVHFEDGWFACMVSGQGIKADGTMSLMRVNRRTVPNFLENDLLAHVARMTGWQQEKTEPYTMKRAKPKTVKRKPQGDNP